MDSPGPIKATTINRWLPYWAVFQVDLRQTLRSWGYRAWVLSSLLAAVGYLLYRVGVYREAGILQPASILLSDLLHWTLVGSAGLLVVLTAGSIASERGTMADSVLSRGISRYQYFLAKWHARLLGLLGTFLALGLFSLVGSFVLLHEDLSLLGSLVALATGTVLLATVITCGVTVSAMVNSTVLGIAILWLGLYALWFVLSLLPAAYPTPDRALSSLPNVLRGHFDLDFLGRLMAWSAGMSVVVGLFGMGYFSRRDV